MKKLGLVLGIICLTLSLFAQGGGQGHLTDEKKKEFEVQKIAYITQELKLTPQEAEKFWPLYNEMQDEIRKAWEHRRPGKGKTADLTEEQARQRLETFLSSEEKMLKIKKEYYQRIADTLSAKKLLLLFEAERNFQKQLMKKLGKDSPRQ